MNIGLLIFRFGFVDMGNGFLLPAGFPQRFVDQHFYLSVHTPEIIGRPFLQLGIGLRVDPQYK